MADTPRPDPFTDVISLVAGPIAAVIRSFDQLRRGAEELMKGLENFNATMENLNETAGRINRLLNDFEEPIRAMLPQLTRTVKLADELSARLAGPIDQVAPGLARLADTLNSPVLMALPTDLTAFLDVINDLSRRMSPLAQLFDQAGGLFGMRIPGLTPRPVPATASSAPAAAPPAAPPPPVKKAPAAKKRAAKKKAPSKKATAKNSTARKSRAR